MNFYPVEHRQLAPTSKLLAYFNVLSRSMSGSTELNLRTRHCRVDEPMQKAKFRSRKINIIIHNQENQTIVTY